MTLFLFFLLFIGIAVGLAWFLIFHDHGEREPVGALWLAAAFGFLAAFPTMYMERNWLHLQAAGSSAAAMPLLMALGVGAVEEGWKFVPLALFIYKKRYFNEHTDGVIYFALAGLGFGLPENLLYTASFGSSTGLARVLLTPFFHAAITAFVGYFLARQKVERRAVWWVGLPLGAAMVLHGLYDFGLSSGQNLWTFVSICITFGLSMALFVLFNRATTLDQEAGLSLVGHNNFCRTCGWPNPRHHLYCVHCGKNA